MSLIPASGAPGRRASDETVYIRSQEQFYSTKQWGGANTPPNQIMTRGVNSRSVATLPLPFGDLTTPAGTTGQMVGGRGVLQLITAAGAVTRVDNSNGAAAMPVSQQFSGVDAIVGVLLNRPLRRYSISVPVRRTVAGTARLEFGIVTSGNLLTFAGTPPGAVLSSDPAVNGGNYVARYRQVGGGAITDVNLSVAPTAWHKLEMRYTEGALPLIEWLIDDVILRTVSGDANMPTFPGGVNFPGFVPGYGISPPAGSTWQFGEGVYEVRDIS